MLVIFGVSGIIIKWFMSRVTCMNYKNWDNFISYVKNELWSPSLMLHSPAQMFKNTHLIFTEHSNNTEKKWKWCDTYSRKCNNILISYLFIFLNSKMISRGNVTLKKLIWNKTCTFHCCKEPKNPHCISCECPLGHLLMFNYGKIPTRDMP